MAWIGFASAVWVTSFLAPMRHGKPSQVKQLRQLGLARAGVVDRDRDAETGEAPARAASAIRRAGAGQRRRRETGSRPNGAARAGSSPARPCTSSSASACGVVRLEIGVADRPAREIGRAQAQRRAAEEDRVAADHLVGERVDRRAAPYWRTPSGAFAAVAPVEQDGAPVQSVSSRFGQPPRSTSRTLSPARTARRRPSAAETRPDDENVEHRRSRKGSEPRAERPSRGRRGPVPPAARRRPQPSDRAHSPGWGAKRAATWARPARPIAARPRPACASASSSARTSGPGASVGTSQPVSPGRTMSSTFAACDRIAGSPEAQPSSAALARPS